MEILLSAAILLVIVTVLGHGLWLFLAALFRRMTTSDEASTRAAGSGSCPRCGLPLAGADCGVCRWPTAVTHVAVTPARSQAALQAIRSQIERLRGLGILDEAVSRSFAQAIFDEQQRLAQPAPVAPVQVPQATPEPEEIVAAELVAESPAESPVEAPSRVAWRSSVEERVAAYAARQQQAAAAASAPVVEPARSWTDWLSAFMEERNIRWGELVGGLLIVCCSIALVVSFWSAIAERPWLKFLLFNGVTAALFGVGFYSEHRWRLRTTSQGLLTIGGLLVPLNFLAIAAFASAPDGAGLLTIVGEAFSAGLFGVLLFFAGRILVQRDAVALALGLLVPSLAQLLVRRFVDPAADTRTLVAMAAVPVACYLAVNFWSLRHMAATLVPGERQINATFRFLGMTSFAVLLPIALLLFKTGNPLEALRQLPALAALLGVVPLAVGLLLWQKLAGRGAMAALRTAGTSVAVAGALVTLAGLVIAWPEPGAMLPAALVEFVIFTFVAWRFGLPAAHLLAAPCLALAYLLVAHLIGGPIEWSDNGSEHLARTLLSGSSGVLLAPLVVAYAGAAYLAVRRGWQSRLALGAVTAALAAVSVALVSWFGFGVDGDPLGAARVYLLYAACFFAVSARHRHPALAWTASGLLLAAAVQGIVFDYGNALAQAEVTAMLVFCTAAAAIACGVRALRAAIDDSPLSRVAWHASLVVSLAAAGWLAWVLPETVAAFASIHWAWLAAVWLAAALAIGWLPLWTLFQSALVLASVCAAWSGLQHYDWFVHSPPKWFDPWTLQTVGLALVALNLCWAVARIVCRRLAADAAPNHWSSQARELLASPWLSVDRVTNGVLVAVLVLVGTYAAVPGTLQELSPRDLATARVVPPIEHFEITYLPHAHAADWGSWALLAGLLVLLAATLRDRMSTTWLACLFITAAVSCPLLAARFESQVAVASALRWLSAALLLAGSLPIWARGWLAKQAARLGWQPLAGDSQAVNNLIALVFFLSLVAPVAMGLTIGVQALVRSGHMAAMLGDALGLSVVAAVSIVVAAAMWGSSRVWKNGPKFVGSPWSSTASALVLVLGTAPVLSVALYHVALALKGHPILGPDPASIFHRMGLAGSYAAPILITALVLVGFAIRERASGFGLAGGLVLNAGTTAAYLLAIAKTTLTFDAVQWIRLVQLGAAVAATYTLAWVGLVVWHARRRGVRAPISLDYAASTQAALAPAVTAIALVWAWFRLVWYPEGYAFGSPVVLQLADAWGWLSFAVVCGSVAVVALAAGRRLGLLATSAFVVALAILAAGVAARWDSGNWLAFDTLFVGHMLFACGLLAGDWRAKRASRAGAIDAETARAPRGAAWIVVQSAVIVLLAFVQWQENVWWAAGGFALAGLAILPLLAWIYQRRRYLYLAAPLVGLAGMIVLTEFNWIPGAREFVYWLIVLAALPVPAWLFIELRSIARRRFRPLFDVPPAHRLATRAALVVLVLVVGFGLLDDATGSLSAAPQFALNWLALLATLVAAVSCLWDARFRDSIAVLYGLGLVACGTLLDGFNLTPPWLLWTGTMLLAAYALATSYLWSRRRGLLEIARSLGIPRPQQTELAGLSWLVPANLVLVSAVVLMTLAIELSNQQLHLRILAAQATLAQAVSVALLARGDRRGILQLGALKIGAIGAVMFGWAWLEVGATLTLLHALVVVAAATALVAVLYGLALGKLLRDTSDWLAAARRITPYLAATSVLAIAATLAIEVYQFAAAGKVIIAWPAILVVAVTLAGLSAAALAAAVLPGRDPLSLSERGRTLYVYGAEIILALLFVHVRVTMPWLFTGFFEQFWPIIVMAIAYLGVGFAELFRRRQQNVLAEPLENTGALLPVLPVIGYWATNARVDYSLLLLGVGVLYAGLSVARRSFGFGVLAALAANGGLWFFLGRQDGLGFLYHPQVWLIPPAVCILAAAYLNRRQLSEPQMTAIRYFTSMAIYLSSTADIFLNGVARAPWLPLVLAGLSILGILAGIVLRVRAFLFLGTGFLALALFTIIWYAAVDLHQTWIWFASGIVAGFLVLALVGIFEKKRQNVLAAVERLKQWEA